VKITREFHDNESENISAESIGGPALIDFFVPDAALIRGRRLIEGGTYSSKYGSGAVGCTQNNSRIFPLYYISIWKNQG